MAPQRIIVGGGWRGSCGRSNEVAFPAGRLGKFTQVWGNEAISVTRMCTVPGPRTLFWLPIRFLDACHRHYTGFLRGLCAHVRASLVYGTHMRILAVLMVLASATAAHAVNVTD